MKTVEDNRLLPADGPLSDGALTRLDVKFARFLAEATSCGPELERVFALLSNSASRGHICLDLEEMDAWYAGAGHWTDGKRAATNFRVLATKLRNAKAVGEAGEYKPLILTGNRLYLYRYWDYERRIIEQVGKRVGGAGARRGPGNLKEMLDRYFPGADKDGPDWQKVAAATAMTSRFCVISGGPGTGKTTTVAKILGMLFEEARDGKLDVVLAAPTGKAAARLQEAVKEVKRNLPCSDHVRGMIPEKSHTIHRLLGVIPDSPDFRYNAENKLPADVVIVDEASMIDVALFARLMDAVGDEARLILLGDKDQLASVEPGAVLGDICNAGKALSFSREFAGGVFQEVGMVIPGTMVAEGVPKIQDHIIQLQKNYRYGQESGIGALSRAVNGGDGQGALDIMRDDPSGSVRFISLPGRHELKRELMESLPHRFSSFIQGKDRDEIFSRFESFRILSGLRLGPHGVRRLNRLVEEILEEMGILECSQTWYKGRPVMVTENDYNLRLFNGDVGMILPDQPGTTLKAFLRSSGGTFRKFPPPRIPVHDTVYAMTVHKCQGSEFDGVLFILPASNSPIFIRELCYTAVTRAREHLTIMADPDEIKRAVQRKVSRRSGLTDALTI
jgi:exodeoxyribonuclease V alpha subunit